MNALSLNPLASRHSLAQIVDAVVAVWPQHEDYLSKSLAVRSAPVLDTSEMVATAILRILGEGLSEAASDYRKLCAIITEEELHFARTGRYRYSTFAETNAFVYRNDELMSCYMQGLLLSHILWFMHASSLNFFCERLKARVQPGGRVLEVGPGHGLLLYLAQVELGLVDAHGWDLSKVSLVQTAQALARLGATEAKLVQQDMHQVAPGGDAFDLVILSHILEHLETPIEALERMRATLKPGGKLFVNLPVNAPFPDHLILLETPEQTLDLVRAGGFHILEYGVHTVQAASITRSLKRQTAITCSIIAELA